METKKCRNPACPKTNPQPVKNFYTYKRDGKIGYRSYCKPCYILRYAQSNPTKRAKQKAAIEARRKEEVKRHLEEDGFIPRKYRTSPPNIPPGKFWCSFCEELHDDDTTRTGSARCPEYRAYILNRWRQNPVNQRKERKYLWVYRNKKNLTSLLKNHGFVSDIRFDYQRNAFILEVLPDNRRMIRIS